MRLLCDPRLVNDAFGDPALYVDLRDEGRALLFDLGDVSRLPPRLMLRLSQVFVSHTHMDHFAGFDSLLRVVLGRKERLELFGGPGFVGARSRGSWTRRSRTCCSATESSARSRRR